MVKKQHCNHCGHKLDVDASTCTQYGSWHQVPEKPATATSQDTRSTS